MKKIVILGLGALLSVSALADKIGTVDYNKILNSYSGAKVADQVLTANAQKAQKDIIAKQTALQKEADALNAKGDKVTAAEKKAFENKVMELQKFMSNSEDKMIKDRNAKLQAISDKMLVASKAVAAEGKYDYILESGAVYVGGEDVTAKVLQKMEAMK